MSSESNVWMTATAFALRALARGAVIVFCHCAAIGSLNADAMTKCLLCFACVLYAVVHKDQLSGPVSVVICHARYPGQHAGHADGARQATEHAAGQQQHHAKHGCARLQWRQVQRAEAQRGGQDAGSDKAEPDPLTACLVVFHRSSLKIFVELS